MIDRIARYFAGLVIDAQDLAPKALSYAPNWNGRATRTELFVTLLLSFILFGVLSSLLKLVIGPLDDISLVTLTILILLPLGAAAIRRVHDTNRYWVVLLTVFLPYLGWFWLGFYLLQNGTRGPNEYGPDPRERRRRL